MPNQDLENFIMGRLSIRIQIEFQSLNLFARSDSESLKNKLVAYVLYSLLSTAVNPL